MCYSWSYAAIDVSTRCFSNAPLKTRTAPIDYNACNKIIDEKEHFVNSTLKEKREYAVGLIEENIMYSFYTNILKVSNQNVI